jgi:hypothetical protein
VGRDHPGSPSRKILSSARRQSYSGDSAYRHRSRAREDYCAPRPFGFGQIDAVANTDGPVAALVRHRLVAWSATVGPDTECVYRIPEFCAVSLAHRDRQCRGSAGRAGHWRNRAPQARPAHDRHSRSRWFRDCLSERTFWWHEAAGGFRVRACGRARSAVHGRALLSSRCLDCGELTFGAPRALVEQEDADKLHLHRDPQY